MTTRFHYVRQFESDVGLMPNTWIVIRVDGKGFSRFTKQHKYVKPNDLRGNSIMDACAMRVFKEHKGDVIAAFGHSDEYSFVLRRTSKLFNRRPQKLATCFVSLFPSAFVYLWRDHFDGPLASIPVFDARAVCYPDARNLKDYFAWRQMDTHRTNLYNTCFWALIQKGKLSAQAAELALKGTAAAQKNELLFSRFGINYNDEPEISRRGSLILRDKKKKKKKQKKKSKDAAARQGTMPCGVIGKLSRTKEGSGPTFSVSGLLLSATSDGIELHEQSISFASACLEGVRAPPKLPRSELRIVHPDMISPKFWRSTDGALILDPKG